MHRFARKAITGFTVLLGLVGAVALYRDTYFQGQDFVVFWNAAKAVLSGQSAYDLGRDGGMVFKYPPWILPAFFPAALMPLTWAKGAWGILQLLSLGYAVRWLVRSGCTWGSTILGLLVFWGVWAVHAMDGQITLLVLALSLWAWDIQGRGKWLDRVASVVLVWALSTKIFSAFSLLGARGHWGRSARMAWIALVLGGLSLPLMWTSSQKNPVALLQDWKTAAQSGNHVFGGEKVRARENQGFPAMVLRMSRVPAVESRADIVLAGSFALVLALVWGVVSRSLSASKRWAGWLALGVVIHPLAWIHSFVMAFPLAVFGIQRRNWIGWLGLLCIAVVSRRTLGDALGSSLEAISIRSWGVVLSALAVVLGGRFKGVSRV